MYPGQKRQGIDFCEENERYTQVLTPEPFRHHMHLPKDINCCPDSSIVFLFIDKSIISIVLTHKYLLFNYIRTDYGGRLEHHICMELSVPILTETGAINGVVSLHFWFKTLISICGLLLMQIWFAESKSSRFERSILIVYELSAWYMPEVSVRSFGVVWPNFLPRIESFRKIRYTGFVVSTTFCQAISM